MAKTRKLPSGNYNVKVYAGKDKDGKRIYESFTAPTKNEAEYMASQFRITLKNRRAGYITVKEAVDRYIESRKDIISPSTYREYKKSAERDLKSLHNIMIPNLTEEIMTIAVNEAARTHSPKTIKNMYFLFTAAIKMFDPNANFSVKLPENEQDIRYIPSDEDIKILINHVRGKPIEIPILLASTGSLRRSEISALLPDDITDSGVHINKAMVLNSEHKWVIKRTKTKAGTRFVPLPPKVIKIIRTGIPAPNPDTISHQFTRELDKCGLPHFTFHSLRHYYASTLHALNVPDKYIMLNGGWENKQVLQNIYQHALSDKAQMENIKIINFFESITEDAEKSIDS